MREQQQGISHSRSKRDATMRMQSFLCLALPTILHQGSAATVNAIGDSPRRMQRPPTSFYPRIWWARVMSTLLILAIPAAWAQGKEWEKHMNEGGKAYAKGMSKRSHWGGFTSQTNLAGATDFAKAEREFLDALTQAQSFPAGDVRTADTLGRLADTYSEERRFDEAEERGRQAIALLEGSLTTNNPDLGYASIGTALIYDSESKLDQAAPRWDRALAILNKTGNVNPQVFSNLEARALNLDTAERAQVHQSILDLRQSATAAPQQDQATLYFFNTSGWSLGTRNQTLLDNEKKIVDLDREKYVVLTIAPGHHVLRLKHDPSKKHQVDLDATPGITYYVAGGYHPRMPAILSTWSFAEIPKDEADKLLAEMKPQAQK